MDLLAQLKMMLGIAAEDTSMDAVLHFMLDSVTERIVNYCHIDALPDGLTHTAVEMAMELYRTQNAGAADAARAINSVTLGKETVSYGSAAASSVLAGILYNYTAQLNAYRVVAK